MFTYVHILRQKRGENYPEFIGLAENWSRNLNPNETH